MSSRADGALSARQQEILKLLSLGRSNKEIAQQLRLSTGTVKQHVYALFRKLGVTNRTAAVVRGAQRMEVEPVPAVSQTPAEALGAPGVPEALRYTRRLVTAVVVEPRPEPVRSSRQAARMERQLVQLRERVALLAHAYDASSEPLPGGGMAAWFGQRVAHGDDAARAVAFARALLFSADGEAQGVPCAIGLGTVPEIVGAQQHSSLAFRAFRMATLLASFGEPSQPLACESTVALAGLAEMPAASRPHSRSDLPLPARVLALEPAPSRQVETLWGGLPFVAELERAAARSTSQWVAVESWPPEDGTRLIAAIGESLGARGFAVFSAWMPSSSSGGSLSERLLAQLRPQLRRAGRPVAGQRLEETLTALVSGGRAALLAYGIDALPELSAALGAADVERLRSVPLTVVSGAMRRSGESRTAVRLLGSDPASALFSRVLRLNVPAPAEAPQGMRSGVQAVLDGVSAMARAVARAAADAPLADVALLASALGAPRGEIDKGCAELERAGIAVLKDGQLRFRDPQTSAAIRASLVTRAR